MLIKLLITSNEKCKEKFEDTKGVIRSLSVLRCPASNCPFGISKLFYNY